MTDIVNELIAGDTLDFVTSIAGYPASDGWQLKYALRGSGVINLTATAQGADYRVQADAATTSAWAAGEYAYTATVTQAGQRYTVGSGRITIKPDLTAQLAGYDSRTVAERALADAEAALANLTASGKKVREYTIGSRAAKYYTAAELVEAIRYWKIRVANEQHAAAIANGLGNPRNLHVRFR